MTGRIYKGIGGFYSVKADDGRVLTCRARGILRKLGQKPLAGDAVAIGEEAGAFTIDEILPRKNEFVRPPVANVDQLFIVASTAQPTPSFLVIDKLTAAAVRQGADVVVIATKPDLAAAGGLLAPYEKAGFATRVVQEGRLEGLAAVRALLQGKLSVFCGNTGVGKSTLLNALLPEAARQTGTISQKLGRGRHTTREVEIFEVAGGLVADTPGFASFDLQRTQPVEAAEVQYDFPEMEPFIPKCRFTGCSHVAEEGCAVRAAVQTGDIAKSRYDSYVALWDEAAAERKR